VTAPSGVFFVRVQARNAFGISGPSNEVRIEVRPSAPEPPVATVATVTGSAVRLQWQAAPQGWPAVSYVLEAGSRPGASDITVVPVSGIEFRAIGVPPGRYYVRVRAVNANGMSAPGQEVLVEAT
jgi:predicted phage tail protein